MSTKFLNVCAALAIVALTVYVLVIGQSFLQPLVVAVVLWYLIVTMQQMIKAAVLSTGWRLPYGVAMLLAIAAVVGAVWLLVVLTNASINELVAAAPRYQERFQSLVQHAAALLELPQENPLESIIAQLSIPQLVSRMAFALTALAGDVGLILIYTAFLLLEYRTFNRKLEAMSRTEVRHTKVRSTFEQISYDIKTYVRIKTTLGLTTALLCYAIMRLIGLQLAEFWSVIIFIAYFIPTVGALLGVFFPALLLLIQFENPVLILTVAVVLLAIPTIMNNVVEPRLVGRSLNLSSLVIIVSLVFWGLVWGVLGMFLCVPFMVIINIILAKFEATRPIAILLSADGNIDGVRRPPPLPERVPAAPPRDRVPAE
jgi:predicted PurR-regulated permease PerM